MILCVKFSSFVTGSETPTIFAIGFGTMGSNMLYYRDGGLLLPLYPFSYESMSGLMGL